MAYRHLKKFKIDPILYMTEWFMCIFSRTLPWSCVLRVWDMFFCEGETEGGGEEKKREREKERERCDVIMHVVGRGEKIQIQCISGFKMAKMFCFFLPFRVTLRSFWWLSG